MAVDYYVQCAFRIRIVCLVYVFDKVTLLNLTGKVFHCASDSSQLFYSDESGNSVWALNWTHPAANSDQKVATLPAGTFALALDSSIQRLALLATQSFRLSINPNFFFLSLLFN